MPTRNEVGRQADRIKEYFVRLYGEYTNPAMQTEADGERVTEGWLDDLFLRTLLLSQLMDEMLVLLKGTEPELMLRPLLPITLQDYEDVIRSASAAPWEMDEEPVKPKSASARAASELGVVAYRVARRIRGDVTTIEGDDEERVYADAKFTAESRRMAEDLLNEVKRLRAMKTFAMTTGKIAFPGDE